MAEVREILVPDIGGAADVEVIELLANVGDSIDPEQGLISVETDKATMEIPSPVAGRLVELRVAEGDRVGEGSLIALLEPINDASSVDDVRNPEPIDQPPESPEPVDAVQVSEEKPEAPRTEPASESTGTNNVLSAVTALDEKIPPYSSPSIRLLARELDVYLPEVKGSGARGRITRDDVMNHVRKILQAKRSESHSGATDSGAGIPGLLPWPKVDFEKFGPTERRALSRIRKISGANLHRNWVSIPHVTNHEDADITDLEAFRVAINKEQADTGTKVTLLALLIKACVAALQRFPEFNASLDGEDLILKNYYHIGFAADTPNGLLVPVLRDADQKGVMEIAREVSELAARAREGKLTADQMSGGCFSISSLGGIGGTYFTPIINAPEVAILGVSKARQQMIWNGQSAEPRLILPMSLSWDHRVIDGAAAGRFNAYLAAALADFRRIVL